MALINCPECNKEVSDKAEVCIHCGYPLNTIENKVENLDGYFIMDNILSSGTGMFEYKKHWTILGSTTEANINSGDAVDIYDNNKEFIGTYRVDVVNSFSGGADKVKGITKCSITFFDTIDSKLSSCKFVVKSGQKLIDNQNRYAEKEKIIEKQTTVKCPKCGSTQIQAVPRKWSLMTGFLTNKIDRVCLNCKHKF